MNLQKIAIDELTLGMYLVELTDDNKSIKVKNPGVVKTDSVLQHLQQKMIKVVTIDIDKSTITAHEQHDYPQVSLADEIHRARRLMTETKDIMGKLITSLYDESLVDIKPVNNVAGELVDSLLANSDALLSLTALRTKDEYLLEHSINVGVLMVMFGRHLGFSHEMLKNLMIGGIIHDIGKTQVDIDVLNKPAKLTDDEFEHMKQHQVLSLPLLDAIPQLSLISRDVSTMHHEKLDGGGYPLGLKGLEISLVGRMSSIVDIYDALTAVRVYKSGMPPAKAFKIMSGMTPQHLDKSLLHKFMVYMGFYPVGSLVELSDGMAGLVWEANQQDNKKPTVKVFYSTKYKNYRDVKFIDLSKSSLAITRGLCSADFPKDIADYRAY